MLKHFGYLRDILKQMYLKKSLSIKRIDQLGSRKSGKTVEDSLFAIDALFLQVKTKVYVIRNMSKALEDTWTEIKNWWIGKAMGVSYSISETKKIIRYGNSEIECRSLHTQNDKSIKLTGLASNHMYKYVIRFIDERHEISKKDEQDLSDAIRGCENLLEINSCNPWTILNDYIREVIEYCPQNEKQIINENQQFYINKKDKRIIHYQNWKLNHFLKDNITNEWRDEALKLLELENLDPISARVRSIGLVGMESGGIYTHLIPKISRLLQSNYYFSGGLDYGFKDDALATCFIGFDKNFTFVNVIDCLKIENKLCRYDNKKLAQEVINFYIRQASEFWHLKEYGLIVYCDFSNYTFIEMLNDCAIKMNCHKWLYFKECQKYRIELRIGLNIGLMATERLNISLKSEELLKEFRLALWDEKSIKQVPIAGNDHLRDAFEYAWSPYLRNISANINPYFLKGGIE